MGRFGGWDIPLPRVGQEVGGFGGLGSRIRGGKEGTSDRGSRAAGKGSRIADRGPGSQRGKKRVALRVVTFLFDIGTKKLVL